MLKQFVSGIAGALMFAGAAMAGPLEDGLAAMNSGNFARGVTLLRPLAEQGNALAQGFLGAAYDAGAGVKKDDIEAVKWWRLAAEQGDAGAQFSLGLNYANGTGVPKDYVLAYMWWNLSAAAQPETGDAALERDGIAAKMTPDQIAEAQRLAREWKPKAGN